MASRGLRVAFDMDGTVADMHVVLRRHAEELFGPDMSAARVSSTGRSPDPHDGVPRVVAADPLPLDRAQLRSLWAHVERIEDFWTTLPEMSPGIVARIAQTARARAWDVIFITTRPSTAGAPTQLQTQRWLRERGFEFPSVLVLERSRGRLADVLQLHAVVDDRAENCLDIAVDSKARALMIWPGSPERMPAGLQRVGVRPVATIDDALAWLEKLDDRRRRSPMMRAMHRLLARDAD